MSEMVDKSGYFAGPGMLGGSFEDARLAAGAAAAGDEAAEGLDGREPDQVVFYELARKFVETEEDIPEDAKDVLYYTLAVGHHTGVMDCFEPRLSVPVAVFDRVVEDLPEGEAKRKLACVRRFGEIQIDKASAPELLGAVDALREGLGYRGSAKAGIDFLDPNFGMHTQEIHFLSRFLDLLERVRDVSGVYVTGRLQ